MPTLINGRVEAIRLSTDETGVARRSGRDIAGFVRDHETQLSVRVRDDRTGREIEADVPAPAMRLLAQALAALADGRAVSVMPMDAHLSTQQAADLVGVSRPYLVKLLEEGRIPYHKVGSQRRVRLDALRAFVAQYEQEAAAAVTEMTAEAQRMGLYE